MKTRYKLFYGMIGAGIGYLFGVLIVTFGSDHLKTVHEVLTRCEQTLPRNQHCELVAVPVEKVEE